MDHLAQLDDGVLGSIVLRVGIPAAYLCGKLWLINRRFRGLLPSLLWEDLDLSTSTFEALGADADERVSIVRRLHALISRSGSGPSDQGGMRSSPRPWPFSGLSRSAPQLINLSKLRSASFTLDLSARSTAISERTHVFLRLAVAAWVRDLLGAVAHQLRCGLTALSLEADELPADEDLETIGVRTLHDSSAAALVAVFGQRAVPSVERLALSSRLFLGYEAGHLAALLALLPGLRSLALDTQSDDALDAAAAAAVVRAAPALRHIRAGLVDDALPQFGPLQLEELELTFFPSSPADFAALAATAAGAALRRLDLRRGNRLDAASLRAVARLPALEALAFALECEAGGLPWAAHETARALDGLAALPRLRELSVDVSFVGYVPDGPRPERAVLAALARLAAHAPAIAALSIHLVKRAAANPLPTGAAAAGPDGAALAGLLEAAAGRGVLRMWSAFLYDAPLEAAVAAALAAVPPTVQRVSLLHRVAGEEQLAPYAALGACRAGRLLIGVLAADGPLQRVSRERLLALFPRGEGTHAERVFVHVQGP